MNSEAAKQYTVSVVVPAYNAEKFIARTIDSVLAQSHLPDEIIVVDDGSTDNTLQVIQQYGPKVKLIQQKNAGPSAARNTGIQAATGEWIAFLDSDDEWLPEKLQLQIDLLKRNPHLAWTTANFYRCLCDENRKTVDFPSEKLQKILAGKEYFANFLRVYIQGARGHTDTMLVKRQILLEAGTFRENLTKAEDLDMWMRIAYRHPQIGFNPEPLAIYHLTIPQSISTRYKSTSLYHDFIRRHLALADELDCLDQFKPCAAFFIRRWIRGMLFESRGKEIKDLITEFSDLFSLRYKTGMTLLASFPQTTALACHTISKIVRTLKLRKQAVRPPRPRIKD
jgi:glycosyltransferase involved in cell wall biosynthesis